LALRVAFPLHRRLTRSRRGVDLWRSGSSACALKAPAWRAPWTIELQEMRLVEALRVAGIVTDAESRDRRFLERVTCSSSS